jgi:hypothetical protein
VDILLKRIARQAFKRGMGGEWIWLGVAVGSFMLRRMRKESGKPVTIVLKPGDEYTVTMHEPRPRAQRSKATS